MTGFRRVSGSDGLVLADGLALLAGGLWWRADVVAAAVTGAREMTKRGSAEAAGPR